MTDIVVEARRTTVLEFGPARRRSEETGAWIPVDLSVTGTKLWFTVKANRGDADAIIEKTYEAGGAADGISVSSPSSTTDPNGTITIDPADLAVDQRHSWYWDLTLLEIDGRLTTVERGAFKVTVPVTVP